MVAILTVKESEHKTYRDMAAYLAHNSSMSLELGLDQADSLQECDRNGHVAAFQIRI